MSKGIRLTIGVLAAYFCIAVLHVWLNVGFDAFRVMGQKQAETSFRVGFLPVT